MPYTPEERRKKTNPHLDLALRHIIKRGDLTYALTYLLHKYALANTNLTYEELSSVRACAIDTSDEFYRVVMGKYEDNKKKLNGNISELDNET